MTSAADGPQLETNDAIPIRLEPITGVYQQENGTYILSRSSEFRLALEQEFAARHVEVSIIFSALNEKLYGTFPLHLYVYVNGLCTEIVALEREYDRATTHFRVEKSGILQVGVQLRNRVRSPDNGDIRLPALMLVEVMAKCVTEDPAPFVAPYVPTGGYQPAYGQPNCFNYITPSSDPIFIIGSPRSGTSILTWSIGAHPNIYPIEETNFFPVLALSALANYRLASNEQHSFIKWFDVDRSMFMQAHGAMMHSLIMKMANAQHRYNSHVKLAGVSYANKVAFTLSRAPEDSKRRWVDGAPINTGFSYLLSMMYPSAKFIHIVRHPVSVIASLMRFDNAGGISYTYETALEEWLHQVHFGRLLEAALGPDTVLSLRFEQLVDAPAEHMRTIFSFLREPRYEAAKNTMQANINSSKVELELLEQVRHRVQADDRQQQLLSLYEGTINNERSAATTDLINKINDSGTRLVKTIFGHELKSVF